MIRALVVVTIHPLYVALVWQLRLCLGGLDEHQRTARIFGNITSSEDGSALKGRSCRGAANGGRSDHVLVGSGAPEQYCDDAMTPRMRGTLKNTRCWICPEISTAGRGEMDGVEQGLLHGKVIDDLV